MNPPDEFLKHAADCEQMAKFARDPQGKATWNRMAERWRRCAEKFTSESLAAIQAVAAPRLSQCEMMAKCRDGVALDRRGFRKATPKIGNDHFEATHLEPK